MTNSDVPDITFEKWIGYVFDHPAAKPEWYWDEDAEYWDGPAEVTVKFLTQTFEHSGDVLLPFSDAQVNQGLWFLASPSCSDYMFAVLDETVPWPDRRQCIRSIYTLFEECFAKRCSPHLSHLDEPGANPLNSVCYMWWDIFPAYGQPDNPARAEVDSEFLNVMEKTLYLDSDACCESALHGLGHWQLYYPETVAIIDGFLAQRPQLRSDLERYPLRARVGSVL